MTARVDRTYIQRQRQKRLDQKVREVECFKKWEYENARSLRVVFQMSMFGDREGEEGLEIIGCCLILNCTVWEIIYSLNFDFLKFIMELKPYSQFQY